MKKRFIIAGCGRVGARLADMLDAEGYDVVVIDKNIDAFRRLNSEFGGSVIVGTAIDEDVLRRAGIETATGFAAVTNDDNDNIMASQVAKLVFKVPRVTARVYDPARQDVYRSLGLSTISPIKMGAEKLKHVLENGGSAGDCP